MLSLVLSSVLATAAPTPAARPLEMTSAPSRVMAYMTDDHGDPKNGNDAQAQESSAHRQYQFTD